MGDRGPKATPTEVLAARGSWRAAGRTGEPQFPVSVPECPEWVPEAGRKWFTESALTAAAAGYMAEIYSMPLALGAQALAEFLEVNESLKSTGYLIADPSSRRYYTNPLWSIRNKAFDRYIDICLQFGFTPASKTRLTVGAKEPSKADDKSRFFKVG